MKKQHFIINYEVYPFELMVIAGHKLDKVRKLLTKRLPKNCHKEIEVLKGESLAETFMFSCGATVILFSDRVTGKYKKEIITHESFHAVKYLMDEIGQKLTDESEESYAYLQQYIFKQIMKKLK
jgi:hypothetical protein